MKKQYMVNLVETLGKRVVGYSVFDLAEKQLEGFTEKEMRDMILNDEADIFGMQLTADEKGIELKEDMNIMRKSGINSYSPVKPIQSPVSGVIYSLVGLHEDKAGKVYEVINHKYGHTMLQETKLRALLELSCTINGIRLEGETIKTWFDTEPKEEPAPAPKASTKDK